MQYSDKQIDELLLTIKKIQSTVYDLACIYSCYDYKIIYFYNAQPETILGHILDNINRELTDLIDQLVDFVAYYEICSNNSHSLYKLVSELCLQLSIEVPITWTNLSMMIDNKMAETAPSTTSWW